jgi:hypothetical protein
MNARFVGPLVALAILTAVLGTPSVARAVNYEHGMILVENPTNNPIVVTVRHDDGRTETVEVGSYRKAVLNGCCFEHGHGYPMTAVYASHTAQIVPTVVHPWTCPRRDGSSYAYARVILSTGTGRSILNTVVDGSCYSG